MANTKISDLPVAAAAALTDLLAIVDTPDAADGTKQATIQQLANTISSLAGIGTIADADLFAVNDDTDSVTKSVSLAALKVALASGFLSEEGENWKIIPCTSATATVNGTTLQTEYTAAKAQTPFGSAVSKTNPYFLILMPGIYDLGATPLTMDNTGVGLIGIEQPPNNPFLGDAAPVVTAAGSIITSSGITINQTQNSIRMENLTIVTTATISTSPAVAFHTSNDEMVWIKCNFVARTDPNSRPMETGVTVAGYWEDCWTMDWGAFASGAGSDAAGTFIRCFAGGDSNFGGSGNASGTFIDCHTGGGFANASATGAHDASGLFINCVAMSPVTIPGVGYGSFGNRCNASGTFINCQALGNSTGSFGGRDSGTAGRASGIFINCYAEAGSSFGGGSGSQATGSFINCVAVGGNSFGSTTGVCTGLFVGCRGGTAAFAGGNAAADFAGVAVACVGGTDSFGGQGGDFSGIATACYGGDGSFAGNSGTGPAGTLSGICTGCFGSNGCFSGSVSGNGGTISGRVVGCFGDASCYAGAGSADIGGTISGKVINCYGGDGSFAGVLNGTGGTGGTITSAGALINCHNDEGSFCGGGTPGSIAGRIERCSVLGEIAATITGRMSFMDVTATTINSDGIQVGAGATIGHCTIRGDGTGDSIGSAGAVTVSVFLTATNSAFAANVTNDIETPNNVLDTDV